MPLCYGCQGKVHHTGLSWSGDAHTHSEDMPCPALPIVAVTSVTWPLCWWFLPDQGSQHWRRNYFGECRGWCGDSVGGSAQGIVDGGGRLPMTQSRTARWWVQRLDRYWSSCSSVDASCSILFCSKICWKRSLSTSLSILTSDVMVYPS